MLTFEGPIWLKPTSPACELFPANLSQGSSIAFFCFSGESPTNPQKVERQLADTLGRLTRALPLFLAEQSHFNSNACVQTMIPWMLTGGFILSGSPWDDELVAGYARQTVIKSDYVISGHLKSQLDPWGLDLRLVRTIDSKCLSTTTAVIDPARPQTAFPQLTNWLFQALVEHADIQVGQCPSLYQPPADEQFPFYLLRLEQLLAVRCAAMDDAPRQFLSGEREIIDGNIHLCLSNPQNTSVRILMANTLMAMKYARPDILPEFKEKLNLLHQEHPLSDLPDKLIQRIVGEVLAA